MPHAGRLGMLGRATAERRRSKRQINVHPMLRSSIHAKAKKRVPAENTNTNNNNERGAANLTRGVTSGIQNCRSDANPDAEHMNIGNSSQVVCYVPVRSKANSQLLS